MMTPDDRRYRNSDLMFPGCDRQVAHLAPAPTSIPISAPKRPLACAVSTRCRNAIRRRRGRRIHNFEPILRRYVNTALDRATGGNLARRLRSGRRTRPSCLPGRPCRPVRIAGRTPSVAASEAQARTLRPPDAARSDHAIGRLHIPRRPQCSGRRRDHRFLDLGLRLPVDTLCRCHAAPFPFPPRLGPASGRSDTDSRPGKFLEADT
jgi:hypothetical protein